MVKVAVIGGGMSGAVLGALLNGVAEVVLFEKARGLGGRMSTRRTEHHAFDHGTPFFTAKSKIFRRFLNMMMASGSIEEWALRLVDYGQCGNKDTINMAESGAYYLGVPTMNAFINKIALSVEVKSGKKVAGVMKENGKWTIVDQENRAYSDFDWVICTTPPSQMLAIVPEEYLAAKSFDLVQMSPCFVMMVGFKKRIDIDFDVADVSNAEISKVIIDHNKPHRKGLPSAVVYSTIDYAEKNLNGDAVTIKNTLLKSFLSVLKVDPEAIDLCLIHKWVFSELVSRAIMPACVDPRAQFAACGDWNHGGGVEGAFLSAYRLSKYIRYRIMS